jgi:hypothetical protein
MDSNLKATILACIFTLLLSISAAYGVLKIDDADIKGQVHALQSLHVSDMIDIEKKISDERYFINRTIEQQMVTANKSMGRLDEAMIKFSDKAECISNTMGRLDERLKSIESGRK